MKRSTIILLLLEIIVAFVLIMNTIFLKENNPFITISFLITIFLIIKLTIGYERDKNRYRKEATMNIVIYTVTYQLIIYIIGIFLGFSKTVYSLEPLTIITNLFPVILLIVASEVVRYSFVKKIGTKNKWLLMGVTVIFTLLDITLKTGTFDLSNGQDVITILSLIILPSIANNILLTYIASEYGYLPNILYRLIMEATIFILPIIPDLGDYLSAILLFVFPLVALYFIRSYLIKKKDKKEEFIKAVENQKVSVFNRIITIILIIIMVGMIVLTSGVFKIYSISIGSGSMEPALDVGDVVIISKTNEKEIEELKVHDILVFEHSNKIVVHRIVEINKEESKLRFITKGDNNLAEDSWFVTEDMIIGKVLFSVKYIGYPTIWLNENM